MCPACHGESVQVGDVRELAQDHETDRAAAVLSQAGAPLSWTNERAAGLRKQSSFSRRCWLRESEEGSG
jgi:hypothetical protein